MDTTINGGEDPFRNNYVSCIKVNGVPILPPLMTEEKRREMRSFKERAIQKEKELREKRMEKKRNNLAQKTDEPVSLQNPTHPNPHLIVSPKAAGRSRSQSPIPGVPVTSTPRVNRVFSNITSSTAGSVPETRNSDPSKTANDIPESILRERKVLVPIPLDLNKSESTETDVSAGRSSSGGGAPMDLTHVGLSKLQTRMQMMSPALFRTPADAKSPLLKGLVFPDPLDKPRQPIRIPPNALDPSMKGKFDKISSAVKGYLTRRLLNTEKVQNIVQTIRDTVDLLLGLYEETQVSESGIPSVKPQDSELHQRLIQQLTGAFRSFHDVFFKLSMKERMAIIATDREKLKTKAMRGSPTKPSISNATLKSIERRMSHRMSPKGDNRKSRGSKAFEMFGSRSVNAKQVKSSSDISPKRRRISYWDDGNKLSGRSGISFATQQDLNGNSFKGPTTSARSQVSSATSTARSAKSQQSMGSGRSMGMGDTFVVPPASASASRSSIRRDSSARPSTSRHSQATLPVGIRPKPSSRNPWNAERH